MADTNLFPGETGFTPRPAWQVIDSARRQLLSGELTLPTVPATRVYLHDGLVYYAERSSDCTLPVRLMISGVINRTQMLRGTITVNGIEHIGRMFDADPTIDRAAVELCAELVTDDVMVGVANESVGGYRFVPYRRHPSGLDRWYLPAAHADETAVTVTVEPQSDPFAAPITQRMSVIPPTSIPPATIPEASIPTATIPEASIPTATIPLILPTLPPLTGVVPVLRMPAPSLSAVAVPVATSWSDVDATAIADEVTAAIERAFAASGSAM